MRAIRAWAAICGALLLAALCLRILPTTWQGVAIIGGVMLTNIGLLVYNLPR